METSSKEVNALAELAANAKVARQRSEKLRHELQLATQEEEVKTNSFETMLQDYSRKCCNDLARKMQNKLPAELRALVYEYLFMDDRPILVGPLYHFQAYYGSKPIPVAVDLVDSLSKDRVKHDHSRELPADMITPESFLFDVNFMGEAFVSEVTKGYYANNVFSVCHVEEAIRKFLFPKGQLKGPDRRLANNLKRLEIRLKAEGCTEKMDDWKEYSFLHTCYKSLEPVVEFVNLAAHNLNVEIIIMTNLSYEVAHVSERAFANILQAIRRHVYTLIHETDATVQITAYDEGLNPFPRNMTGLFSLTKEQWEFEKQKLSEKYASYPLPTQIYYAVEDGYIFPDYYTHQIRVHRLFGGYANDNLEEFTHERWGVDSLLVGKAEPKYPIVEGYYWPTRREGERGVDGLWRER